MKLFSKTLAASLFAASFTFAAPQVLAETVTLTNASGPGVAPELVVRTPGHSPQLMWVGGQGKQVDAATGPTFSVGDSLLAWCLEVALPSGPSPSTYDVANEPLVDAWVDSLKRLFTMFGAIAAANPVNSAAMQLAIWEVVGGDASYDLGAGNFQAYNDGSADSVTARNQAQTWLTALQANPTAWNDGYKIVKLTNEAVDHQDLVTFVPTPLPGAALMFLSALGLGGLARRKQKADPGALAA